MSMHSSALKGVVIFLGPMAQTPADAAPDEMSTGDLETARQYGARSRNSIQIIVDCCNTLIAFQPM